MKADPTRLGRRPELCFILSLVVLLATPTLAFARSVAIRMGSGAIRVRTPGAPASRPWTRLTARTLRTSMWHGFGGGTISAPPRRSPPARPPPISTASFIRLSENGVRSSRWTRHGRDALDFPRA